MLDRQSVHRAALAWLLCFVVQACTRGHEMATYPDNATSIAGASAGTVLDASTADGWGGSALEVGRFYANVHGLRMHYLRQGAGPTVVLLHGGTYASEVCWKEAIPFLAEKFSVIAVDQMGHGRTNDDPSRPFSYHEMAEDTIELLRQLGVQRASLVGWSDGGNIALDIAMNHASIVERLVTSGANFSVEGQDPSVHVSADKFPGPSRDVYGKISPDGAEHWPIVLSRLRQMWATEPHWTREDLSRIQAPSLIIAGDADNI